MDIISPEQLGAVIQEKRKSLDYTQQSLADAVGVSRLWVNQIEQGKKENASLQLIIRTLNTLGLTLRAVHKDSGPDTLNRVFEDL